MLTNVMMRWSLLGLFTLTQNELMQTLLPSTIGIGSSTLSIINIIQIIESIRNQDQIHWNVI